MSVLTQIAQAVTDQINAATFAESVVATRSYVPEYKATDSGLSVFVVCRDQSIDLSTGTRASVNTIMYVVTVAMYKRLARDTTGSIVAADMDAMMLFVEQVMDVFSQNIHLTSYPGPALVDIAHSGGVAYDPKTLESKDVFVSGIDLTFQLQR